MKSKTLTQAKTTAAGREGRRLTNQAKWWGETESLATKWGGGSGCVRDDVVVSTDFPVSSEFHRSKFDFSPPSPPPFEFLANHHNSPQTWSGFIFFLSFSVSHDIYENTPPRSVNKKKHDDLYDSYHPITTTLVSFGIVPPLTEYIFFPHAKHIRSNQIFC